ncbi:hypothetical protein JW721_00045 [Candidatus Micrarchaeota archaeon]|nr:hypothetical protein [Candidatus Micrarchaeota archaeon]
MSALKKSRVQNPKYLKPSAGGGSALLLPLTNPPKEGKAPDVLSGHPARFQEDTGNRKPETENENRKMGPRGFEPLTYGCLRPLY